MSVYYSLLSMATAVPGSILNMLAYVFTALALYTMAEKRGIRNAWMAWVPVLNVWILGSLSDQYRYVVRGEVRNRRKVLLTLKVLSATAGTVAVCVLAWIGVTMGLSGGSDYWIMRRVTGPILSFVSLLVPFAAAKIAGAVFYYLALFDVYTSCDPDNRTLYIVLSIFFKLTVPFFLFFNRDNEKGMPPRRGPEEFTEV